MNNLTSAAEYIDKFKYGEFAVWLITILLVITGFQRIKEIVAFVLMKLYEFFIQRTAISL